MSQHFFNRLDNLIADARTHPDDKTAAAVLAREGTPTTSIAILENGKITTHIISTQPPDHPQVNADTLFQACSISKAVASLAAFRLIEQGVFKLDTRIVEVLPEKTVNLICPENAYNSSARAMFETITVSQLLSHTSGLSIHGFPGYQDRDTQIDTDSVLSGVKGITTSQVKLVSPPGHSFMYSGGGFTVLQRIMEHTTGADFEQIMRKAVFEPLDMKRSFYALPKNASGVEDENVAPAHHTGYTPCKEKWHYQPELAAAGLWTTPADLLKLIRAVQKALKGDCYALIKKKTATEMLTRVKEHKALGFSVDERTFGHGGSNMPGYECLMFGYANLPQNKKESGSADVLEVAADMPGGFGVPEGCGIAIMTNSTGGRTAYIKVLQAISYLKGWGGYHLSRNGVVTPFMVPAAESLDDWREWVGTWKSASGDEHTRKEFPTWYIDADRLIKPVGPPIAGIDRATMSPLVPAAMPAQYYDNDRWSIDFVVKGLAITLRMKWEQKEEDAEPQRVVEICNSGAGVSTILRRV